MSSVDGAHGVGVGVGVPLDTRGVLRRIAAHIREPLHRDGYALVLNSALTAATGLLYWVVAAKEYTPHALGLNSALISSMMFLGGLASLNLANVLVRFLPQAGRRSTRMLALAYAATGVAAAAAAAVFIAGIDAWAPRLGFLSGDGALQAWFVIATVGWCAFAIQDGALTALGRAVWVPIENAVFSLVKLALLAAIAAAVPFYGIFVSWTIAMLLSVVGVNVVLFTRLTRRAVARTDAAAVGGAGFRRYFAADYLGALAWLAATNLMPVVVTATAGATTNAWFAMPWALAFPLYAIAANVGTSLVLHGASGHASLRSLVRKTVRQGLLIVVPAVALVVLAAPYALLLFGADYARHGTTLLRLLALGAIPNLVLALAVATARVERRLARAVLALAAQAALALGLTAPLIGRLGVTGAGIAWTGSLCAVALALLAHLYIRARRTATASARELVRFRSARGSGLAMQVLGDLAVPDRHEPNRAGVPRVARTDSDTAVFVTGDSDGGGVAVKIAFSDAGAAAVDGERRALEALDGLRPTGSWARLVPELVEHGVVGGHRYIVQRALPGVDGRRFANAAGWEGAVEGVARGLAPVYRATAVRRTADERLLRGLMDNRLARIDAAHPRDIRESLAAIGSRIATGMCGRCVVQARVHGDLWLGNVLLTPDGSELTGVVDWEASRPHGLPAVDLAHLALATRCGVERREMGAVVAALVDGRAGFSEVELALLEPYAPRDLAGDEIVLLAWLQHVALRLGQTGLRPGARWMRRNVDPVLARFESLKAASAAPM